jgi:hypothetical protein
MLPRVSRVTANDDRTLTLVFDSGEVGEYDCRPLLDFGVFRALRDLSVFGRARVRSGTVEWPGEIDICPDTLYLDSRPVVTR